MSDNKEIFKICNNFRFVLSSTDFIAPEDIVITSDVDAFPAMSDTLSRALDEDKRVWVFQYFHTLTTGGTFPMSFIGMRKKLWTEIVPEGDVKSLSKANQGT